MDPHQAAQLPTYHIGTSAKCNHLFIFLTLFKSIHNFWSQTDKRRLSHDLLVPPTNPARQITRQMIVSDHAIVRTSALPIWLPHSFNYFLKLPVSSFNRHLTCVFLPTRFTLVWSRCSLPKWFSRSDHDASSVAFTYISTCIRLVEQTTSGTSRVEDADSQDI